MANPLGHPSSAVTIATRLEPSKKERSILCDWPQSVQKSSLKIDSEELMNALLKPV